MTVKVRNIFGDSTIYDADTWKVDGERLTLFKQDAMVATVSGFRIVETVAPMNLISAGTLVEKLARAWTEGGLKRSSSGKRVFVDEGSEMWSVLDELKRRNDAAYADDEDD